MEQNKITTIKGDAVTLLLTRPQEEIHGPATGNNHSLCYIYTQKGIKEITYGTPPTRQKLTSYNFDNETSKLGLSGNKLLSSLTVR